MKNLETIKINEQFHIYMRPYGWELHNYDPKHPWKKKGKPIPRKTHHATVQQLCQWVINKHTGNAKDFETLLDALNRASESLEPELTITVENLK